MYGKNREIAKELTSLWCVVAGSVEMENQLAIIKADTIQPCLENTPMSMLTVVGRLGSDPDYKTSASGNGFVKAGLATNGYRDGKKTTNWFNFTAFGKRAEHIANPNYYTKGSVMGATGYLQCNSYKKQDDTESHSHQYVINNTFFMPKGMQDNSNNQSSNNGYPVESTTPAYQPAPATEVVGLPKF